MVFATKQSQTNAFSIRQGVFDVQKQIPASLAYFMSKNPGYLLFLFRKKEVKNNAYPQLQAARPLIIKNILTPVLIFIKGEFACQMM